MLKDEFEICDVMGIIQYSEVNRPHLVRLYSDSLYNRNPLERDVTDLLKNKPYTTLVELIKYVYDCIEQWEISGMMNIPFLTIVALDENKQPRTFHDCVVKSYPDEESGTFLWPTARAKDLFEKKSEGRYGLDLYVSLIEV